MSEQQTQNKEEQKINLNIPAETAKGNYANLVIANYSKEEFILDCALVHPHTATATVQTRSILSPRNAKKLSLLLAQQVQSYEKKHGPITEENGTTSGPISFSFN